MNKEEVLKASQLLSQHRLLQEQMTVVEDSSEDTQIFLVLRDGRKTRELPQAYGQEEILHMMNRQQEDIEQQLKELGVDL